MRRRRSDSPRSSRRSRRLRWWVIAAAALVIVWLGGDFIYSRVVLYRAARWERSVQRDPDGVRVGCRERTLGAGTTALLLVHGFNDCPAQFDWLAPRLAERGYTCRVMRLPGFALPVEAYARTTRAEWREALEREIAGLRASHDRVGIVAHSLGAAVTIGHLLDHPQSVDAAILLAPLVKVSAARSPLLPPRAWHAFGRFTLPFTRVVETPFEVNANTPEARAYDRNTRFTPRKIFDEIYSLLNEIDGRAAEFRTPLLMVLGRHDEVIDIEAAELFYRQSSGPRSQLITLEEAGHMIALDEGREILPAEIVSFFPPGPPTADASDTLRDGAASRP